jgi:hypothetical protein
MAPIVLKAHLGDHFRSRDRALACRELPVLSGPRVGGRQDHVLTAWTRRRPGFNAAMQRVLANGTEFISLHHQRKANSDNKKPGRDPIVHRRLPVPGGVGKTRKAGDFRQLFTDVTTRVFDVYPV